VGWHSPNKGGAAGRSGDINKDLVPQAGLLRVQGKI